MKNKLLWGVIAVIIIVVIAGGYAIYSGGAEVSATGNSKITAQPDEISVYINAQARNDSAQAAQNRAQEIREALVDELVKAGISREDIQLQSINVYEDYDWSAGSRSSKGYIATEQVIVKSKNFSNVARIVDAAIVSGAQVNGINFELSQAKQNEYKAQALQEASADARNKAESTAAGLGKSLGMLVSVGNNEFNYYPYEVYSAKAGGVAADVSASNTEAQRVASNIAPTDMDITASVRVVYKLRMF